MSPYDFYSIEDAFELLNKQDEQRLSQIQSFYIGDTPGALLMLGLEPLPIFIGARHLSSITSKIATNRSPHPHNLSHEQIRAAISALNSPMVIMDSKSKVDTIVPVTNVIDSENNPIVVPLRVSGSARALTKSGELVKLNSNYMVSMYGKSNFEQWIKNYDKDKLLFLDPQKTTSLESGLQLQLLLVFHGMPLGRMIHPSQNVATAKQLNSPERTVSSEKPHKEAEIPSTQELKRILHSDSQTHPRSLRDRGRMASRVSDALEEIEYTQRVQDRTNDIPKDTGGTKR